MRRVLPILPGVLGVFLLIGSAGWALISTAEANPAPVVLPQQMAGLARTRYVTGARAAAQFDELHGKQFAITSGAVGIYGNNQITIWAAGAPLNLVAAQLVNAMHRKISEGRSPFSGTGTLQDHGRTVFELEGMGQRHYYFQSKNLVVWLAAEPALADKALQESLEEFP